MKLENYYLIVLLGLLWSKGAMPVTVNISVADTHKRVESINGIRQMLAELIDKLSRIAV